GRANPPLHRRLFLLLPQGTPHPRSLRRYHHHHLSRPRKTRKIAAALRHLRAADPHLARVIDAHEPPLFQCLHPPFHALARSILYQQLAFKAATSVYTRFLSLCGGEAGVVPEAVLALNPHQLRQIGVSGRKASYLHDLARKYHSGILSDAAIVAMDDKSLFTMLTMVKGIGAWSVHMFMIFSLHRPDVLPVGDLGVRKGVQMLYSLEDVPRPSQMEQLCERWRPYRSVGSWYMWRLGEARGAPTMATSSTEGIDIFAMGGGTRERERERDKSGGVLWWRFQLANNTLRINGTVVWPSLWMQCYHYRHLVTNRTLLHQKSES
ncbi:unnamed protein product, partial [Musa textilis]